MTLKMSTHLVCPRTPAEINAIRSCLHSANIDTPQYNHPSIKLNTDVVVFITDKPEYYVDPYDEDGGLEKFRCSVNDLTGALMNVG